MIEQKEYWERHGKVFTDLYEQPTWFNRTFRQAMFLRIDQAIRTVRKTPGATVLDVGCGNGRNSILMVKEGGAARVLGVDLAEDMIARAGQLAAQYEVGDRCKFVREDFLKADLGNEVFDYSTALGVVDYFRDPTELLAKMRRHTRREALASFPGFSPVRMTLRKIRYGLRGCGVYWFTRQEIEAMFLKAGFASCRLERCTRAGWMAYGIVEAK